MWYEEPAFIITLMVMGPIGLGIILLEIGANL